jgi:electron-transferring-flavoprotein dehydrogenase
MECDVAIISAGPAGLASAIRLKQLNSDLEIVMLDKGAEVGAHILSGNVFEPRALDGLLPDWRGQNSPITTPVMSDAYYLLFQNQGIKIPNLFLPYVSKNHGNYIISLGDTCKWLGDIAEEMGVQIFPGFAATEMLYDDKGAVTGVATGDMGIGKDGTP